MNNQLVIMAAIGAGAFLGNYLKLPSGILTGGMVAGLVAKGIVSGNVPSGSVLSIASQLLVAYVVVSNSDVATIRKHPEVVPVALGYIAVLVLFCLGAAFLLNKVFHIDMRTAIYATAPGGLSGMALSAADAGAETPISMMFHLFRLTLILVSTPFLARLFAR
ncbi:MAG TPA: AbrB family transcriptional regulator [Spirochaetales bacterium]|nr:AbrB family transcriptional regulator [Spirochaetales bacterium]HRY55500.1 AbrB family transcriptional regulator [Spirochaetia bacterium]HRZ64525.1 AbrB family transcriptional regulator [Spirochaetia bacterium]